MGQIKVSFFGLCYIKLPVDAFEGNVYLPSGHQKGLAHDEHSHAAMAPAHTSTLTISVKDIDVKNSQWPPDAIVQVGKDQFACFFLKEGMRVALGSLPQIIGPPRWNSRNRDDSINFATLHHNIYTLGPDELQL